MAQIFTRIAQEWVVVPLDAERFALAPGEGNSVDGVRVARTLANGAAAELHHVRSDETGDAWVVVSNLARPGELSINGQPVPLGISVLRDRDEIRIGRRARAWLSLERLAEILPYPRADAPRCPRCQTAIAEQSPAVRCPNPRCAIWHHESGLFPCWSYDTRCALCDQPTALDPAFRWSPEELGA